jgi:hypothetical protein
MKATLIARVSREEQKNAGNHSQLKIIPSKKALQCYLYFHLFQKILSLFLHIQRHL